MQVKENLIQYVLKLLSAQVSVLEVILLRYREMIVVIIDLFSRFLSVKK